MAVTREFCFKHQILRDAGEQCGQCATEGGQATLAAVPAGAWAFCPDHDLMYHVARGARCPLCQSASQRDTINVLGARIADQDQKIAILRRRQDELRNVVLDLQRAHNVSVRE